jgi:EAL domain-containing protein (putative c-di-GMP-specific phosphodiesterase class I)/GGDEF domain-containing protein
MTTAVAQRQFPAVTFRAAVKRSVNRRWADVVDDLGIAYQPIIDIHSGRTFGFEALMRGVERHGFTSPIQLLNQAFAESALPDVEARFLDRAIKQFATHPDWQTLKLFINIDGRTIASAHDIKGTLVEMKSRYGLTNANLAMEVSERFDFASTQTAMSRLIELRQALGTLAIDDFGAGHANLQLFYHVEPAILKLDRFLISSIASDPKKTVFLKHIVMMAHILGAVVIAEGIETPQELYVCRDLGCDLAQGYLIARPTTDVNELLLSYTNIPAVTFGERRRSDTDAQLIEAQLDRIEPLRINQNLDEVFARFAGDHSHTFFPVIDEIGQPLGIVRERDIRNLAYSRYGKELTKNPRRTFNIPRFVTPCARASLNGSTEKILEVFSSHAGEEGILILQDSRYVGFLHSSSLLQILNDKNLRQARDQNPLSKLPGNVVIHDYVSASSTSRETSFHFAYLDFDNFKPFNDKYGFRLGDRAIQMFSEALRSAFPGTATFVGHVGGDDFFVGFAGMESASVATDLQRLTTKFRVDVESLYSSEDRANGFIDGQSRTGEATRYPLLSVSTAIVHKPIGVAAPSVEDLSTTIAEAKKRAKRAPSKQVEVTLGD